MNCVNLKERFGKRFKITFDECYDPRNRPKDSLDPWMMQIPCLRGIIYPHGGTTLAVEVDYRTPTAKRLAELDCCRLYQDGDQEKTFHFDVADFATVAKIVKPRRRRRMTDAQKQAARERLAAYQFQS